MTLTCPRSVCLSPPRWPLISMRFNMKVLVCLLLVGVLFITVNFWTKCTDLNRQDNNFYRDVHVGVESSPRRDLSQVSEDKVQQQDPPAQDADSDYDTADRGHRAQEPPRTGDLGLDNTNRHPSPQVHHDNSNNGGADGALEGAARSSSSPPYREIDCVINDEYTIGCRKEGPEVFLPFTFISKYFEVYGKLEHKDKQPEHFSWHHSYSKVYPMKDKYTPSGVFMSFEHYNVEVRDRVKCISAIDGVPISTQWGPEGYHYPIQIAQYGLSHYSKYLMDTSRKVTILEDAEDGTSNKWSVLDKPSWVHKVQEVKGHVVEFQASEALHNTGVTLPVNTKGTDLFLSMDFKFVTNGSITVTLETKGKSPQLFYIHYVCSEILIDMVANEIFYGMGKRNSWSNLNRDLSIDLQKGLLLLKGHTKKKKVSINKVVSVTFRGHGFVDNVTLSSNAHLAQFYHAANWLVLHQDEKGGWPIYVTRKLANGKLELPPGWYSAMAQGQAMSLLVRAYLRNKNSKYLGAAIKAMRLFDIPSAEGGILAMFADKYPWYEEYPTMPHSFVLNGFIYSLIGLYDLTMVSPREDAQEAQRFYNAGITSLIRMLPLFDTGSGSIYDLRHFTLGSAPNLARWDYHATHINQLLLLSTIESDPTFANTANRWLGYMNGQKAAHN